MNETPESFGITISVRIGRWQALILPVLLMVLFAIGEFMSASFSWATESYYGYAFGFLGALASAIMVLRGMSTFWRTTATLAWGIALTCLALYFRGYLHRDPGEVLLWFVPAISLLVWMMFKGLNLVTVHSVPHLPQTQFRQLGSTDEQIDPLQQSIARDVPLRHADH